jgi:hypothetical protein
MWHEDMNVESVGGAPGLFLGEERAWPNDGCAEHRRKAELLQNNLLSWCLK